MSTNRRRRPATRPATPADANLINLDNTNGEFAAREPLFVSGGTTYTIPVKVSAGIALHWLEMIATRGDAAATVWALAWALGDDGYTVLRGRRDLSDEHYAAIVDAVRGKFVGALERSGPKARTGA